MELDPVILSRIQFGFVISFHIIFPAFTMGLAAWLATIEGMRLFTGNPIYRRIFDFWLKIFAVSFGMGVAFEFRYRSAGMRRFWDAGFACGSMLVAFAQGAAVGAMMRGIPVENMQYAGGAFTWLHPFPILTGVGLMFGYALLGACWIAFKTEGALQDWAYTRIPWLVIAVCAALGLAFIISLTIDAGAIAQSNLRQRHWGLIFPILSVAALLGVLAGARARRDGVPFAMTVAFFCAAFLTLGVMFWPYLVPYAVTVADAAAPEVSLRFFFYGGILVLSVIAVYTIGVYWVFRGKIGRLNT